ncbi:MAG: S41 family peptidase [Flammeovirgaceae bacterium]
MSRYTNEAQGSNFTNHSTEEPTIYNSTHQIRLPLLLSLTLVVGIGIGAIFFGNKGVSLGGEVSDNAEKFRDILSYINRFYVDTVNIEELTETAIHGMLNQLDPHTAYIPAKDNALVNAPLDGEFVGVGIEYNIFRDTVNVVSIISGGPSDQAGIEEGDKIILVDEETVAGIGISNRKIINLLRGEKGSQVKIGIKREGEDQLLSFNVTRARITTNTVETAYMVNDEVGYLKINRFGAKTYQEFTNSLESLKEEGMKKLILDLRDNGGGYFDKAIKIADDFLKADQLIVYTKSRNESADERAESSYGGSFEDGALIVLINEYSASASEIVAGALQDNDRALIVGRRSFGKGLVQRPISLEDNSSLRLTISRYYTPSGRSIQKPYGSDNNYGNDINARYDRGEMFHIDSAAFDEKLKYKTAHKGRTVYGGGGITPDYFVPIDTSFYTPYYRSLINKNLLREYALRYTTINRKKLSQMSLKDFMASFNVEREASQDLINYANKSGVEFNPADFLISKDVIHQELKAFIARNIWGEAGFYPIYHEVDGTFQQCLALFSEAEKIALLEDTPDVDK